MKNHLACPEALSRSSYFPYVAPHTPCTLNFEPAFIADASSDDNAQPSFSQSCDTRVSSGQGATGGGMELWQEIISLRMVRTFQPRPTVTIRAFKNAVRRI